MTERYDHRTEDDRVADAEEPVVIDQPVTDGAAELREEALRFDREEASDGDGPDRPGPSDPGDKP